MAWRGSFHGVDRLNGLRPWGRIPGLPCTTIQRTRFRQTRTAAAIAAVTAIMATPCTTTSPRACHSAAEPRVPPAVAPPRHSGISAGTSARPAPWAVDTTKDPSPQPACPASARTTRGVPPARCTTAATTSRTPASACSSWRSIDRPDTSAAHTMATEARCPTVIGTRDRSAVAGCASGLRMAAGAGCRHLRCRRVAVVVAHPLHLVGHVALVAAPGREVQQVVGAHHHLHAAPVGRVGVEDVARVVLEKGADARRLLDREGAHRVVVVDLAARLHLRRKADVEVVVEVAAVRGQPGKAPAHALAETLDAGQRRARDRHQGDVALRQVRQHAVGVVGHEGATRAALFPVRAEHEVLHQQLASAFKQLGERAPAFQSFEDIVLLDAHPGQRTALARDLVAQLRQFLLARQQRLARGEPLVRGHDGVVHGVRFSGGLHGGSSWM
eukprot:Opistho-1_new@88919